MKKRKGLRITAAVLLWLLTVSWGYFIYFMSAKDSVESGNVSGTVAEGVAGVFLPDYESLPESEKNIIKNKLSLPIRKLAHFTEFAVFGGLLLLSSWFTPCKRFKRMHYLIFSTACGIVYAALDEMHQGLVPGRAPRVTDVLIDTAGVICGVMFVALMIAVAERKISKNKKGGV